MNLLSALVLWQGLQPAWVSADRSIVGDGNIPMGRPNTSSKVEWRTPQPSAPISHRKVWAIRTVPIDGYSDLLLSELRRKMPLHRIYSFQESLDDVRQSEPNDPILRIDIHVLKNTRRQILLRITIAEAENSTVLASVDIESFDDVNFMQRYILRWQKAPTREQVLAESVLQTSSWLREIAGERTLQKMRRAFGQEMTAGTYDSNAEEISMLEVRNDIEIIVGGNFARDHLGPEAYDQIGLRFGAHVNDYLREFERLYLAQPRVSSTDISSLQLPSFLYLAISYIDHEKGVEPFLDIHRMAGDFIYRLQAESKTAPNPEDPQKKERLESRLESLRLIRQYTNWLLLSQKGASVQLLATLESAENLTPKILMGTRWWHVHLRIDDIQRGSLKTKAGDTMTLIVSEYTGTATAISMEAVGAWNLQLKPGMHLLLETAVPGTTPEELTWMAQRRGPTE